MRVFAFYSYKGGSGRTTTMLNTVKYLIEDLGASPEKPILLVDADLESAGLTFYFNRDDPLQFAGTLSASNTFENAQMFRNHESEDIIFGVVEPSHSLYVFQTEVKADLKAFDGLNNGVEDITELFKDVALPVEYITLLGKALNVARYETNGPWTKRLRKMAHRLRKANTPEEKVSIIIDSMPTVKLVDVSNHFNGKAKVPGNTVLFLGTDLSSDSHVSRKLGEEQIISFIKSCEDHGYSAVVFDCGSGTQSSADILHGLADVIVYCMRPSVQFISGTSKNLDNYKERLEREDDGRKPVIIVPNAVPQTSPESPDYAFCADSFKEIQKIVKLFPSLVDGEFCTDETCIHEVPVFKWREMILGCSPPSIGAATPADMRNTIEKYSCEDEPSIQGFTKVYKALSKCLVRNSEE